MTTQIPSPSLRSRVYGCWLGKSVGGTLGIPAEGRMERLHYTYYDPVPMEAPPNDDLELQLVWLHVLETKGFALTQQDMADAWLAHIHYMWDEYGRCRWNLRRGVPIADAGAFENAFVSGMGSPIRSEIWACVCLGNADLAAKYAALDASLDHGPEGIAGEVFLAVMQTLILGGIALRPALEQALAMTAQDTETAQALHLVIRLHDEGIEAWQAREMLLEKHPNDNFTHTPINVGLTAWALLYGNGDFDKTILLSVNCGYDTDCTGATAGATLGLLYGDEGIPTRWREPLGENVLIGPGIIGIDAAETLTDLTDRTLRLAEKLAAQSPPSIVVPEPSHSVALTDLPGTIFLTPLNGIATVPFANGELHDDVKRAGGATWQWTAGPMQDVLMIAVADSGAQLFVDGIKIIDCPAGGPYVPATHRSGIGTNARFRASKPVHEMRLELGTPDETQRASVLLVAPNFHLAPWSGETLPYAPTLEAKLV